MKTAIWFSRHQPTTGQMEDAARMGYALTTTFHSTALGGKDLADNGDVLAVVSSLLGHCADTGATAIFGVFAAPILAQLARTSEDIRVRGDIQAPSGSDGDFPCFAAWNVMRAVEGGKPTFEHREWVGIGQLNQNATRWLE